MACDCKIKLEKELRENGYHLARLSGLFAFVGKDGTLCKGESTISLSYPFCPFCGKKFEEDKE